MKEKILQLCKRLSNFTLDKLETITEMNSSELKPILQELISENKIIKSNGQYLYKQAISPVQKYSILKYYNSSIINLIIKCFCLSIPSYKAAKLAEIGDSQAAKIYNVFRTAIYELQKEQLVNFYNNSPQQARNRIFFNQEFYFYYYENQVFISDILLESDIDKSFTSAENKEFKNVYSYMTRCAFHNSNSSHSKEKLAEFIWRRNKDDEILLEELKYFLNIS